MDQSDDRESATRFIDDGRGLIVRPRSRHLRASVTQFGNPWHDEVGKFAPKGTGKKYGHGPGEDDSRPSLADRHDLDPAALTEEERLAKKRYDSYYVFETAQLEDAQSRARDKAKQVPKPTEDDVIQGQVDALLAREGLVRAGGDRRGNNTARKRRAKQLVEEFGDGETCPCVDCGQRLAADTTTAEKLGIDTLTQDKILVGTLGGSYKIENLIPACGPCNQSRGDREGVGVVGDVRQSWGSPERFTRQVVRDNGDAIAQRFQERRAEILDRKGISWEEHLAANPDALPQDWDQLRRPVGGNFAATVDRFDRGAIDSDAVHHELGVRDAVRVDRVGQQRPLDGGVVDGVVEAVESVVPPEPFGSHHRAVRRNHRHQGSFANPWHDELGKFAPKGEGTNAETAPPAEDYHYSMRPDETGPRISDMADVYADVLDNPRNYTGFPEYVPETIRQLRKAATDPHAEVTVYRAAPPGASLNDGDWVTLSKSYAETHAQAQDSNGNNPLEVMAVKVPAGAIRWAQNDIMEWGYFPNTIDDNLTASAATEFMNPWHDEIGRFAPKGTGKRFGKNVSWHVGSNGYEVMHNGSYTRAPEAIKHYGAIEVANHMTPDEVAALTDELDGLKLGGDDLHTETDVVYEARSTIGALLIPADDLKGTKTGFDFMVKSAKYVRDLPLGLAMQLYAARQFTRWPDSGVDGKALETATQAHMNGEIDTATLSNMIAENYGITVQSGAVGWFNRAWQISAVSHEAAAMQMIAARRYGLDGGIESLREYVQPTTLRKAGQIAESLDTTISNVIVAHERNTAEKLTQAPELLQPRIHRGLKGTRFLAIKDGDLVQSNPLSSWSYDPVQAQVFATNANWMDGIVITANNAPANVLTISDISGLGSLSEREVIMIGRPVEVTNSQTFLAYQRDAAATRTSSTYLIDTPDNVDWIKETGLVASPAEFANPWHDELGKFAPKGEGTQFIGDAAEATQRARDDAAQGLPPSDFDGPQVYRTIALPITKEQRASIEARNQPATTADEWNQHLHIGPELVEQALSYGGHQGMAESSGLGQHWTTKESLADSVSAPGRDTILVKFAAKPRQSDIIAQEFPDGSRTGESNARGFVIGEEEVRLAPKSPVDLNDVQISYGDNQWHSVWGVDERGFGAGRGEFERNYGKDTGFAARGFEFANPWHDEIGRFAPKGTGRKFVGGEVIDDEQADADFEDEYGNARPSGDGDCFPAALHYVMYDVPRDERDRYRIVHGVPEGQGPIAGLRFDHAWVERTDPLPEQLDPETRKRWEQLGMDVVVIDKSNGQNIEMPRVLYYQLGNIEEKDVKRYTFDEAATQAIRTKHYGPWT